MNTTTTRRCNADRIAAVLMAVSFLWGAPVTAAPGTSETAELLGPPPGSWRALTEDGVIQIPFEVFRSEILMRAEINGRPVRMAVDNGYLWDQLLMFGSPTVDSLGLEYAGVTEVGGSGSGDPVQSRVAEGITVTFPGAVAFYDQVAIVTPYTPGAPRLWQGIEGQVSAQFFKHFVVEFNFDTRTVTLTEPDRFRYAGTGVEVPLEHLEHNAWGSPCRIEMGDGTVYDRLVMWDIGLNDALQFETNGPAQFPLPADAVEASLGFGMQGETTGHTGHVRSFEIGGYRLENIESHFSTAAHDNGTDYDDVMVGFAILRQFNAVFDYPHGRVFLSPAAGFSGRIP